MQRPSSEVQPAVVGRLPRTGKTLSRTREQNRRVGGHAGGTLGILSHSAMSGEKVSLCAYRTQRLRQLSRNSVRSRPNNVEMSAGTIFP